MDLAELAKGLASGETRDRHWLASERLPSLLDLDSRKKVSGRPQASPEIRALIRKMAAANPLWGAPRIHGELLKLGIEISERTVSRLLPRKRRPPSQSWKTFLDNHAGELVSI